MLLSGKKKISLFHIFKNYVVLLITDIVLVTITSINKVISMEFDFRDQVNRRKINAKFKVIAVKRVHPKFLAKFRIWLLNTFKGLNQKTTAHTKVVCKIPLLAQRYLENLYY